MYRALLSYVRMGFCLTAANSKKQLCCENLLKRLPKQDNLVTWHLLVGLYQIVTIFDPVNNQMFVPLSNKACLNEDFLQVTL